MNQRTWRDVDMSRATGRVTLQDIAQATGYTSNTISRALKDKPDIAPKGNACRGRIMLYLTAVLRRQARRPDSAAKSCLPPEQRRAEDGADNIWKRKRRKQTKSIPTS